jgi:protein-L-isoaspartate(D-aspartate) O-methyltransferase
MTRDKYSSQRQVMVDNQIIARGIKDQRVINALLEVPRHLFIDEAFWPQAYDDNPLPIGEKADHIAALYSCSYDRNP